MDNATNHTI